MDELIDRPHQAPCSNRDLDFFYAGLEDRRILIQQCDRCKSMRMPPQPMCGNCNALEWTAREMAGTGTIYSYVVHRHPPIPGFAMPHPVGVIELDEGVRVVAGLDGMPIEDIRIGLRVAAEFLRRGDVASVRFQRVKSPRDGSAVDEQAQQ